MAYYEKENKKIATLIDFDLATFPEDTQSLPQVTSELTPPQDNAQGVVAVANARYPLPEKRSGTTPFMAIETLDLNSPGYKHHLCHDLESILYVVVWHGLGYRHKLHIYPTENNRYNKDRKQRDILKGWRAGSWRHVKIQKETLFDKAWVILDHIIDIPLRLIAYKLQNILRRGMLSATDRTLYEKRLALKNIVRQNQAIDPAPTANVSIPSVTIFPAYAAALGIVGMECEKSCCVA